MKKKLIVFLSLMLVCLSIVAVILIKKSNHFVFKWHDEEKEELKINLEYGETIDLSPQALGIHAYKGNKEVEIEYQIPDIKELKRYVIEYSVANEEKKFMVYLDVKDTSAPVIEGKMKYKIMQGEPFDQSNLSLTVKDNYDQNLIEKLSVPQIDTRIAGEQQFEVSVKDSSGNESTAMIQLLVKKKPDKIVVSNPNDIEVLVNKKHFLPDGWAPNDLVKIDSNNNQTHHLRKEAASAWEVMRKDALDEGIVIKVVSSYRTQNNQVNLYNSYMATDPLNAPYYSAYPRTSEHELGLGIDISYDYALHYDLHVSDVGKWMIDHGWKYGWILRYPENKTEITGYVFEAWHYRYVGVDLATKLHDNGLTLDEYYK